MKLFPALLMIVLSNLACLSARAAGAYDRINITTIAIGGVYAIPNDGIDDTLQINAAISGANYKSIYFPPGTYNFKGLINVPAKGVRLYGDGPGVSTIIFKTDGSNPTAGIYAPNMGVYNLNVEGLTLQTDPTASPAGCGTAINASFAANVGKFHTVTIHNVQILGSARDGTSGTYWTEGIRLRNASNAVIDKVEISGKQNSTQLGIVWDGVTGQRPTGIQLTNLQIKWCNMALYTTGWMEGLYMNGFEFVSCGRGSLPAVRFNGDPSGNGGAFHILNGLVDSVGGGLELNNLAGLNKVSNVRFRHGFDEVAAGTLLYISGGSDAMVTECSFYGTSNSSIAEHGILLLNAHSVRLAGNNFKNMGGNGYAIAVIGAGSSVVRITDNLFDSSVDQYFIDSASSGVVLFGNNP